MKIVGLTVLHYGADYLKYAIGSVIDYVDEHYVIYSAQGSHGHRTNEVCPDTREQLAALAIEAAGSKLRWYEGEFANEGAQREYIHTLAPDADCIIVVDSDEVYTRSLMVDIVNYIHKSPEQAQRVRLPFWHYWRSFKRGFMHDPAYPERIIFPKITNTTRATLGTCEFVHHFGYAQRSDIVRYKQLTHGHKAEWRKDVDWFTDVFMANRQYDCHPVGSDAWNCEDMDASKLPAILANHPYKEMDVIP